MAIKIVNNQEVTMSAEEETAFNNYRSNKRLNSLLFNIRFKRNALLKETDFYALSDVTMSSDMTTYRQSLRDITNGVDTIEKAENITWPTKP